MIAIRVCLDDIHMTSERSSLLYAEMEKNEIIDFIIKNNGGKTWFLCRMINSFETSNSQCPYTQMNKFNKLLSIFFDVTYVFDHHTSIFLYTSSIQQAFP